MIVNVSMYITNLGAIDETKMVSTLVLSSVADPGLPRESVKPRRESANLLFDLFFKKKTYENERHWAEKDAPPPPPTKRVMDLQKKLQLIAGFCFSSFIFPFLQLPTIKVQEY